MPALNARGEGPATDAVSAGLDAGGAGCQDASGVLWTGAAIALAAVIAAGAALLMKRKGKPGESG